MAKKKLQRLRAGHERVYEDYDGKRFVLRKDLSGVEFFVGLDAKSVEMADDHRRHMRLAKAQANTQRVNQEIRGRFPSHEGHFERPSRHQRQKTARRAPPLKRVGPVHATEKKISHMNPEDLAEAHNAWTLYTEEKGRPEAYDWSRRKYERHLKVARGLKAQGVRIQGNSFGKHDPESLMNRYIKDKKRQGKHVYILDFGDYETVFTSKKPIEGLTEEMSYNV